MDIFLDIKYPLFSYINDGIKKKEIIPYDDIMNGYMRYDDVKSGYMNGDIIIKNSQTNFPEIKRKIKNVYYHNNLRCAINKHSLKSLYPGMVLKSECIEYYKKFYNIDENKSVLVISYE